MIPTTNKALSLPSAKVLSSTSLKPRVQRDLKNSFWDSKSGVLSSKTNATDAKIVATICTIGIIAAAGCVTVGVLKKTIISNSGHIAFLAPIVLLSFASTLLLTFAIVKASVLLLHYNDYKNENRPSTSVENQSTEQVASAKSENRPSTSVENQSTEQVASAKSENQPSTSVENQSTEQVASAKSSMAQNLCLQ